MIKKIIIKSITMYCIISESLRIKMYDYNFYLCLTVFFCVVYYYYLFNISFCGNAKLFLI